jgi:hypothetical protein
MAMAMATTGAPVAPSLPFTTRPAQRLQREFAAVRVSFTWLGVRKTLTPDQKAQAAESFGAEGQYLSAGKKLIDTRHEAYKAVTAIRSKVTSYWRALTLPYPEPGMRLIRQDQIETLNDQLMEFKQQLGEAVNELDRRYGELQGAAQQRLGRLFNPRDYPATLQGLFAIDWDFPSVQPPDYLLQLNPALYEQERARMTARFEEAVTLAETAFADEFSKLVSHLTERLQDQPGQQPKVFRDSAVENLQGFFERFKTLNVRSNAQLDELVTTAQKAVRGVVPQALRDDQSLRQQIAGQLAAVGSTLDSLLVDRPRRTILRNAALRQGGT